MADSVKIIFDAIDNTQRGVASVQNGVKKIAASLTAVIAAGAAVVAAMKKASDAYVNYGEEVSAVARVTGQSAEESSKLIQVADDLFISYEALSQAMKGAVKAGIEPNIESLASLSDQYLALAPGLERSTFLLDKFGKAGLEMGKMMEQGGDAIRAMANNVPEGLIFDEQNVEIARQLRTAWDNLGDSATGFGLAMMADAAPALTDLIGLMNDFLDAEMRGYEAWKGIFQRMSDSRMKRDQFGMLRPAKQDYKIDVDTGINLVIQKPVDTSPVDEAMTEVEAKSELDFIMSFQSSFENFDQTRDELLAKMEETRDKILAIREEMAAGSMRQSEGETAISELSGEMTGLTDQLNANEEKWKQWQKQTAFSLMSAQMLAKGVDLSAILKMGEDFGVLDPEVVAQAQQMMDAISNVETHNLTEVTDKVKYLISQDGRTIRLYVEENVTTVSAQAPTTSMTPAMNAGGTSGYTFINYGPIYTQSLEGIDILEALK